MKANFYISPNKGRLVQHLYKCLLIFSFLFLININYNINLLAAPYPPRTINAQITDTTDVSQCEFPLTIQNKAPLVGQTVKWKVVKGQATLFLDDSYNNMQVQSFKPDTCILTYTTFNASNVILNVDSLVLILKGGCQVIDRDGFMPIVNCGATVTLRSKLNTGYTYLWTSSSPDAEIFNPWSKDVDIKIKAGGTFFISVMAISHSGHFTIFDSYTITAFCSITPPIPGPDVNITACQFPYTLSGNAPALGETVKWEVVSGMATLENPTSRNARILDATNGTQLRYSISNSTQTNSAILKVNVSPGTASICNPIISNTAPKCGDNVSITFNWAVNSNYTFQWTFSSGVIPIGIPNNTANVSILTAGPHIITVTIKSPSNFHTFIKTITLNATCPPPVTIADAGPTTLTIGACQFPFMLSGNNPAVGETVKWEVISGMAVIQNDTRPNATLMDASTNVRLKYTITRGTQTSTDFMDVFINNIHWSCDPFVSDYTPNCKDTISVNFFFGQMASYTFQWILPAGVSTIGTPTHKADLKITTAGMHTISVVIKSPHNYNSITKTITVNATCPQPTQANAGPDASAYCNRFQLSGNKPASGEIGTWKIVAGTATIETIDNPTSYISNFTSGKLIFVWTIANSYTFTTDTVVINVNKLGSLVSNVQNATCGNNNGSALAQPKGGLPPYSVQWQGSLPGNLVKNVPAGTYYVTIKDQSGCQVTDSVTIEDDCIGAELYTVEGNVFAGMCLQPYGLVLLMQNIGGVPIPVKTTHIVNGYYKFTDVEKGEYIVYVLPYEDKTLTLLDEQYLPTFYVNKVSIIFANPIQVVGNTFSVDVRLVEKKPTNLGRARINAHVELEPSTITSLLPVLLFNEQNELVAAGYYNGSIVSFEDLAPGKYYISMSIDETGYKNSVPFVIESGNNEKDIELVDKKVSGNSDHASFSLIRTYPNPFKESINIETGNTGENFTVKLIDGVTSKELREINVSITINNTLLNTEDLPAGFYILQISNGSGIKNIPLIKQ